MRELRSFQVHCLAGILASLVAPRHRLRGSQSCVRVLGWVSVDGNLHWRLAKAGLRLRAAIALRKLLPDLPRGYLQVGMGKKRSRLA